MRNRKYTHGDILKMFPWLKPRTLISWSERGLIKADFGEASGRGSSRVFSYSNLIEIVTIADLSKTGLPFSVIKKIIQSKSLDLWQNAESPISSISISINVQKIKDFVDTRLLCLEVSE
jgi:DNA-binding transcriptional MerR regulator